MVQLDLFKETLMGKEDVGAMKRALADARTLTSIATNSRNAANKVKAQVEAQCDVLRRQIVDLQEKINIVSSLKSIGETE
jgi:hypothetical protein